ncbi:FAD-dependent monooxygenase [Synechococcus sp. Cruz-9H2]|uniref:NAD(P)/FAD-dependent oxidoreductase n=1 Tax=unclassified Synechococcus TaxID=2626047 RepID=UPI0020CE345C|nr:MULTISPECIES: FAD-dependent oxidoreductase [unclassified Synechococcus]MCP9819768.1 FAD-dependent monooxygenase [Synechococcus sp. Cruz-9H2]MCP9844166.1 FAD-dependent monooxygenase [Synechococcus sp. Edmonson 11F2]MCP9856198.1 FAD-dependent monooxygenase [Synechococcus sp. Cruz-9C9]MCP9863483.1 FAD-dependent monooxygenase [Synechococcus sp. Cruz-7E5]MCP9870679.1 FAD-dependent monooxygenase [Synechococcus sp. Cruz-7B9]
MAETLPGELWDVVVIGAGPAGALASLDLAQRGLRVLLVEKRGFPRWKVCGTCFNSQAQAALASVGQGHLLESLGGRPLRRLRLGLGGRQATCSLPPGWALSRSRFDQALVEAAVSAGAVFRPQTTAQLGPASAHARSVSLFQGRHQELVRAAVVLVAAGLAHRCLENEPTAQTRISPRSRVGAGCVLAVVEHQHHWEEGSIHMAVGRHGYVGLVRVENGSLNLAAAFDRTLLQECGSAAAAARRVLAEAGFPALPQLTEAHWQSTPALSRRSTPLAGDRFLVLGDAAGYVEPFTGEGMGWALAAAVAATPLVLEGTQTWRPALERRWSRTHRQRIGRRQLLCRSLALALRHPTSARGLFWAASRLPSLPQRLMPCP